MLENVEFRKGYPSDYRLFQVADLVCTLSLIELKLQRKQLSKSEMMFFNDDRTLKKNYLKPFNQKKMWLFVGPQMGPISFRTQWIKKMLQKNNTENIVFSI